MLTWSNINTALSQSVFRVYKSYIIMHNAEYRIARFAVENVRAGGARQTVKL